ncbi:MAG: type II secretion system protein [Sulfurovum sp.]|nr:type II secretion system protein [Sulfurovum sp.]
MHMKLFRPAIAMIELIFAIVIMGIVMMSAPMLISTASKSGYVALQQEGINEAASRINMIMGYAWDENNTNDTYIPPILHVTHGASDLNVSDNNTSRRTGTPEESQRTYILSDLNNSNLFATPPASLGKDGNASEIEDDMDDFIGNISLTEVATASIDYIEKASININTNVSYIKDNPTGTATNYNAKTISFEPFRAESTGSTNIKFINVTLTSSAGVDELNKTIVLKAFSSNIGGYTLKERTF